MLTFPEFQNVFSPPDDVTLQTAPIPNLERRTASAGIDESLEEQMKTLKNVSISSLTLFNSKLLHMNFKNFSGNDQSEQFMMEDFTKYDSKATYKSVATGDTDTNDESDEESSKEFDKD